MGGTRDERLQGKWWTAPEGATPTYCVALGATLAQLRTHAKTTQVSVANRVLKTPTKTQMSRYELGQAKPSLAIIAALCREYDANMVELLTRVATLSRPDMTRFGPLQDVQQFVAVIMIQYDEAQPSRPAVERKRAARRQPAATDTTSST